MQLAEKMGTKVRRGPPLASIFILMILLHTNICRATSSTKNIPSNSTCDDDQDECLIGDINLEEEFMMASETSRSNDTHAHRCGDQPEECLIGDMESGEYSVDSEISRRLLQVNSVQAVTRGTSDPNQQAVACGNPRYGVCLPSANRPPSNGKNCGIYNRGCP